MPSSTSVVRKADASSAVRSWLPEALVAAPEYPGGGQPPFVQEVATAVAGVKPLFEPIVAPAAQGAAKSPTAWQPLDFKLLETASLPSRQSESVARPLPATSSHYKTWRPPELDISGQDISRSAMSGLAGELLKEAQSAMQSAHEHAVEVLRKAEAQAAQMVADAEVQAAEIIKSAQEQAVEMTRQGYSDGMAAANAEMSELLHTVTSIVNEVTTWRDEMFAQGELMMLRLVIEIAQTIFGDGLPLDPEALGAAFSRALSRAKTLGDLRIYVHPEDAIALSPQWAQQQSVITGQQIELIPSDIIKRGGCFVEGEFGSVDSRVESQLKLVQDTLLAAHAATQTVALDVPEEEEL